MYEDIISFIETVAQPMPDNCSEEWFNQYPNAIVKHTKYNHIRYFGWNAEHQLICGFSIETIDPEHKRYKLSEYDGAEYLEEITDYVLVDAKCSLYK